ncbi:MAG: RodZ domain-containing protein [bacterium]
MSNKVGEILKKRRELESMPVEDVEIQTMIAKKYIVALETGDYDTFPAKVYAKGFLRNYANFIGFSEKEINDLSSQYDLEWQEAHFDYSLSVTKKDEKRLSALKTNRFLYMIMFILLISFSGFLIFYFIKQKNLHQEVTLAPGKLLEENMFKPEDIVKKIESVKENEEKQSMNNYKEEEEVILEAFADEKVWLYATIDGKKKHEILLAPEQTVKWRAQKEIFLTIGNAGGVVFKLNDEYKGALGKKGEVKKILVTAKGFDFIKTQQAIIPQKEEQISTSSVTSIGTTSPPPLPPPVPENPPILMPTE